MVGGTADGGLVVLERDRDGALQRGRCFRLPAALAGKGPLAPLAPGYRRALHGRHLTPPYTAS